MQTNKQNTGSKYNSGYDKILFICSYLHVNPVTYEHVKQFILTSITTKRLESISPEYLPDADHMLMNLKILRKNKNIELASQPRETIEFIHYIINNKDRLFVDEGKIGYKKRISYRDKEI